MPERPQAAAPASSFPASSQPASSPEVVRVVVAGFWKRAAASAVDLAILAAVLVPLALLAGRLLGISVPPGGITLELLVEVLVSGHPLVYGALGAVALITFLYFFLFLAVQGQTPGKRLLRVRVINATGAAPGLLRALGRTVGYVVSALLLSLGFFWIGFDREKRGLHDWLAGTYVVRVRA